MTRTTLMAGLAAAGVYALVAGCGCNGSSSGSGFPIANYASLKPDSLTLKETSLEIAGSKYKAEIKEKRDGDEIQIDLVVNGDVVFETERYRSTQEGFSLIDSGGDRYDPPIQLIKYPMHIGDTWDWKGTVFTGPAPHKAEAKITTSSEAMTINGGSIPNAVRIQVDLAIDSGVPGNPAKRKMTFWIPPNMGVVKRSFGDYSTRTPLEK